MAKAAATVSAPRFDARTQHGDLQLRQRLGPNLQSVEGSPERYAMKSTEELHQKLRQQILALPGVTEREHAGIHEDAFFLGQTMFMHIHGRGHCDIRLSKVDQVRALAERKARPHRWAPEAGYVTSMVKAEADLDPVMDLIHLSHRHFARSQEPQIGGADQEVDN